MSLGAELDAAKDAQLRTYGEETGGRSLSILQGAPWNWRCAIDGVHAEDEI